MHRQVVEIGIGIVRDLVAVVVDALGEIALAIEQADGDEGQAQIGGALAMVAGEDAQAAGIDRKALVEAELGAEIGDQVAGLQLQGHVPAQGLAHVGVEGRQHAVVAAQEDVVFRRLGQAFLVHPLEEGLGIVVDRVPQTRMQAGEQGAGGTIPGVPEVVRQFGQARQAARDARIHFNDERGTGFHCFPFLAGSVKSVARSLRAQGVLGPCARHGLPTTRWS
jgi:hypothetical protein